ncbi:HAMP domain-containing sensor histidine kinase [Ahrensia sp. R2A130]|uniref:sensor histidine kinase n=1 Tax=Ahrensia sp. R2A130 TaxID=744979 RepID=UPI0001E0E897|nr:HAMP domain-containing sensor histidine kinase [Ahrensia sp. R2A130]EFL89879.1 two-component sensor histidine kinase protein [Ahrensia sp. R2A130]
MALTSDSKETAAVASKQSRPPRGSFARLVRGLSGRLLWLTVVVIMLTEVFVFVPSVANFRLSWLADHFTTGEASSLALEKLPGDVIPEDVRKALLELTQTELIVVRSDGASRILAADEMPGDVAVTVEVVAPGRAQAVASIFEAFDTLIFGGDRSIRVVGEMAQRSGTLELVMKEKPLRDAMLSYAGNVLLISLAISIVTGLVVFLTLRAILIRPLQRMAGAMVTFADNPEAPDAMIVPSDRHDEIGVTEVQLAAMQKQVRGTLAQQRHLADLGLAVSKINHDLRNILASASLFSERLEDVEDPLVQRLAPRLLRTIDRAVDYTNSVLAYGKAGEAVPMRTLVRLDRLTADVRETLDLDTDEDSAVIFIDHVPQGFEVQADAEQLFRVLMNLSRNAVQAMEAMADPAIVKRLTIAAEREDGATRITLSDTGPGIPADVRKTLFAAFSNSNTSGGTGLGMAIAAELIRAHGGTIKLLQTDGSPGATFEITLPN